MRKTAYYRFLVLLILATPALAAEKPATLPATCVTDDCHNGYRQLPYLHGPVAHGVCKFCHRPVNPSQHTFALFRPDGELCAHCHFDLAHKKYDHTPLQQGHCTQCHNPHGSNYPHLLPTATVSGLCRNCHQHFLEKKQVLHAPVATGECAACHNAHGSDQEKLLTSKTEDLCLSCHEETMKTIDHSAFIHPPAGEKKCIQCHDPHGGADARALRRDEPELCLSCHKDIEKIVQNATHPHSVVSLKNGCTTCHNPHASKDKLFLKADPMTLCLSCHDKPIDVAKGKTIPSFKAQVENKAYLHGPVKQNNCSACHAVHGGNYNHLLVEDYPAGLYAPFTVETYQLCFRCHPENRILTKETTELTGFRNGNRNLHYVHVNDPKGGRMCRVCHAIHGSNQPKFIRENVLFGEWVLPIQFEKTASGGSCKSGCHELRKYDRNAPLSPPFSASPAETASPNHP